MTRLHVIFSSFSYKTYLDEIMDRLSKWPHPYLDSSWSGGKGEKCAGGLIAHSRAGGVEQVVDASNKSSSFSRVSVTYLNGCVIKPSFITYVIKATASCTDDQIYNSV